MVTAKLQISEEVLMEGMNMHLRYRSPLSRFVPLAGAGLVVFAVILLVIGRQNIALAYLLPLGVFFLLITPIAKWGNRRSLKHYFLLGQEMVWSLDEMALGGTAANGFEVKMTWVSLYGAVLTSRGILVNPQKNVFYWIPVSAFPNTDNFQQAAQYIKNAVKDVLEVS